MKLQTKNLTLSVGKRSLVANLNWQVNAGECWCIIGRNGAGKTTLLRCLAGLFDVAANAGEVLINDRSLAKWPLTELAKVRSYLPQGRNDAFAYRVIESVLGARHPYHDGHYWESDQDLAAAYAALTELDVADLAERDVRSLSGGERQRVAIASLLAQDAQLMLLDEPTNALDLAHQISVMQTFSQRCKNQQKALLMVSHDLNLAYSIATHALLLMGDGSWQAGTVLEIMTEANLSQCLGHPIEMIWHGKQRLFLPVQAQLLAQTFN
ncbi:ABC transporter ATP-binding protein [Solimicrobium silvestre]|uniref:ABC-type cobalamin/Fe3+-siderophore transport systems ATPase component n=1 Tax=Solimicrobium silvestre TaxID=2099400 RepID=A0A2S9GUY5_9BURK|nr:ABC transporter ATP-binding protein [Solimicrobium silvestre]PRC91523.1 ABC-type cobalamin/Fe3+-siderophore transport systems ATPase component [Solimicrobium silvestre]